MKVLRLIAVFFPLDFEKNNFFWILGYESWDLGEGLVEGDAFGRVVQNVDVCGLGGAWAVAQVDVPDSWGQLGVDWDVLGAG